MNSKLPARFETLTSLEGAAISQINLNLPADFWAKYAFNLRGLTEPQLANAAKKFVHPDEIVWIVVGDVRKIEKGIGELGFGEIVKLDANGQQIN